LGETPGWRTLIGAALIIGAALRVTSREFGPWEGR
jgi:drug/metabolite transporter (DMT)-like permease